MANEGLSERDKYDLGIGIAHTIGGVVLTAFGGGALVPVLGGLEKNIGDAAFKTEQTTVTNAPTTTPTTGNTPPILPPRESAEVSRMYGIR